MPTYVLHISDVIQVLQVKENEPRLNETEVLEKGHRLLFPPSSPINVSQQEIEVP